MATEEDPSRGFWASTLDWFLPSFDETTLFLMAVTCIWLLVAPSGLLRDLDSAVGSEIGTWFLAVFAWAAIGLALSVYHAVARREKNSMEKTSMPRSPW